MELKLKPLDAHVKAANVIAKLPFFTEMDPEALLTTYREKLLKQGGSLTFESLLTLFLGSCQCYPLALLIFSF